MITRSGKGLLVATALAAVTAGCGTSSYKNDPRPPSPLQLSSVITEKKVSVSPAKLGAGIVAITATNQGVDQASLVVLGSGVRRTSEGIEPGGTLEMKVDLKEGIYSVSAGERSKAKPAKLHVGPSRPTAQNELLQP